jgi:hypothetical protein
VTIVVMSYGRKLHQPTSHKFASRLSTHKESKDDPDDDEINGCVAVVQVDEDGAAGREDGAGGGGGEARASELQTRKSKWLVIPVQN